MEADARMTVAANARDTKRLKLIAMILSPLCTNISGSQEMPGVENSSPKITVSKHPSIFTVASAVRFLRAILM
jgi:hypothetical protein